MFQSVTASGLYFRFEELRSKGTSGHHQQGCFASTVECLLPGKIFVTMQITHKLQKEKHERLSSSQLCRVVD